MRTWGLYERSIAVSGGLSASGADAAVCRSLAGPLERTRERERKSSHLGTEVYCPRCRKYTGTNLLEGHAWIYCLECKVEIEAVIRISDRNSAEQKHRGVDPPTHAPLCGGKPSDNAKHAARALEASAGFSVVAPMNTT